MKRTPLIFVALTPFVAAAGGGDKAHKAVNHEELRDDWRVSEIIGSEAQSRDGQQYGEVQDVVLSADGRIESVLISADDVGADRDQATLRDDQDAGFDRTGAATTADRDTGDTGTVGATGTTADADETGMAGTRTGAVETDTGVADTGVSGDQAGAMDTETGVADTGVRGDQTGTMDAETGIAGAETGRVDTEAGVAGTSDSELAGDPAVTGDDRTTGTAQVGRDDGGLFGMGGDDNLVAVDWSGADFNADENLISLDVDPAELQGGMQVSADSGMQQSDATLTAGVDSESAAGGQEYRASDLMEMDVHLSDEESFGSVDDILVNAEGDASAVLVTTWDFLDRKQYALPVDLESVNAEEQTISYDLSSQDIEQQGEFDLDEQREGA